MRSFATVQSLRSKDTLTSNSLTSFIEDVFLYLENLGINPKEKDTCEK